MNLKKAFLLMVVVIITAVVVILYFSFKNDADYSDDMRQYVGKLNYKFCCRIVSLEKIKGRWGYGYIGCKLSHPDITNINDDEVMNSQMADFRFIVKKRKDIVYFLTQGVEHRKKIGDSVCIDSKKDLITIFSEDFVHRQNLSKCLKDGKFPLPTNIDTVH